MPTDNDPFTFDPGATGQESSLSSWAGPYVTGMLGDADALGNTPYNAYQGPLTAGTSGLQDQAFQGIAGLTMPDSANLTYDPRSWTGDGVAQNYMDTAKGLTIDPMLNELNKDYERQRMQEMSRLTQGGAFGGSRQGVVNAGLANEYLDRRQVARSDMDKWNYDQARQQFNTEENRSLTGAQDNRSAMKDIYGTQLDAGAVQRGIESEGIAADLSQFEAEKADPYNQLLFKKEMVSGLPMTAQSYNYTEPSWFQELTGGAGNIWDWLNSMKEGEKGEEEAETNSSTFDGEGGD